MKKKSILSIRQRWSVTVAITALPLLFMTSGAMALEPTEEDYELKLLGKYLFFDKISLPSRQSCSSCHTPDAGWTNGTSGVNLKQVAVTGANPHTVGTLKPPISAYATLIPDFTIGLFGPFGGNFWNGRAKGEDVRNLNVLGGDLDRYDKYLGAATDQAHASPFINPVEQGLPNIIAVCEHVKSAKYAPLYAIAYDGAQINCNAEDVEVTFGRFALAIGAFEFSGDVNMFDSKRDRALKSDDNNDFPLEDFTDQENLGHDLFYGLTSDLNPTGKNAGCGVFCHQSSGGPFGDLRGIAPDQRYTGDGYFNIGTPRNVEIPQNPEPNIGLAATTGCQGGPVSDAAPNCINPDGTVTDDTGLHKAPTLRNVDKRRGKGFVKAYAHNGFFKSLESIVHFYNTSNVNGATAALFKVTKCGDHIKTEKDALANNCWPTPEFTNGIIPGLVGNLGLTADEETAIVAYMKTLTDIPTAKAPRPFNINKFYNGQLK